MKLQAPNERRLLYRYDRYDDGSIRLNRPYKKGVRDDTAMLKHDCLSFCRDLSKLSAAKRKEFLDFEKAYVYFYRLYSGSDAFPKPISHLLDSIQAEMERLRYELDEILDLDCDVPPYTRGTDVE